MKNTPLVIFLFTIITALFIPNQLLADSSSDFSADFITEMNKIDTHDFDGMKKRRFIRILVPYSKTFFFFDGAQPKGIGYETGKNFEEHINKKYKTKNLKIHVIFIPTSREKLLTHIKEGLGDIAIGNLTITDERRKIVDFSTPFLKNVDEVLVTSNSQTVKDLFDLSGKEVHVRKSSSYHGSLLRLNEVLNSTGKPPVKIVLANELLEDEDLLEMVNANLIPAIVMDNHKANFWMQIFPNMKVHKDIKLHTGGNIGWAIRKGNPLLKKEIDEFAKKNKKGTLTGNVLFNRYLKSTKYITNSFDTTHQKRFVDLIEFFETYGEKYEFDHLMLAALGFQESKLDQSVRSHVGAVGVMQIMPSTAKDKNVNILDIDLVEPNIHAGTKYLHFMANYYFGQEKGMDEFNKALFSFASYNAGPNRVAKLRKEAEQQGLDPNVWFHNVEIIAAKRIGRETVQYVSNIFKYYVAYKMVEEQAKKLEALQK